MGEWGCPIVIDLKLTLGQWNSWYKKPSGSIIRTTWQACQQCSMQETKSEEKKYIERIKAPIFGCRFNSRDNVRASIQSRRGRQPLGVWYTCVKLWYLQQFFPPIFSKFWFFRFLGGKSAKTDPKLPISVCHTLYLRNSKSYHHDFWYAGVK